MSNLPLEKKQPEPILSSEKFESIKFRELTNKERKLCDLAAQARSLNVSEDSFSEQLRSRLRELRESSVKGDSGITLRELKELLGEEHRVIKSLYAHRDKFEQAMDQPLPSIMAALENDPVFEFAGPEQRERMINRNMHEPEYNELLCQLYLKKLDGGSEPIPPGGRANPLAVANNPVMESLERPSFEEKSQEIFNRFIERYEEKLSQQKKLNYLIRNVQGYTSNEDDLRIEKAKDVFTKKQGVWDKYKQRFQSAMNDPFLQVDVLNDLAEIEILQVDVLKDLAEIETNTRISKNAKYGNGFEQETYNSVDAIHQWIGKVHPEELTRIANRTMTEGQWDGLAEKYFCEAFDLKTEVVTALVPAPGKALLELVAISNLMSKNLELKRVEIPEVTTVADVLTEDPTSPRAIVLREKLELVEANTDINGKLLSPAELGELAESIGTFKKLTREEKLQHFSQFFKQYVHNKLYNTLGEDKKNFLGYLSKSLDNDPPKYRMEYTEFKAMQLARELYPRMFANNEQFHRKASGSEDQGLTALLADKFLMDNVRLQRNEQSNQVMMGNIVIVLKDYQSVLTKLMTELPRIIPNDQKYKLRGGYNILQGMFSHGASKESTVENWQVAQQLSPRQLNFANNLVNEYLDQRNAMMITLNMWVASQQPAEESPPLFLTDQREHDNA